MNDLTSLSEPPLEFAFDQKMHHPRDGLTLFGPFESKSMDRPKQITYGVFGTPVGVKLFKDFSAALSRPILTEPDLDEVLWPHYSGFEELFHATWPTAAEWEGEIDPEKLRSAVDTRELHKRVFSVVNLYLEAMQIARRRDATFHAFVCVVPDSVYSTCRIQSAGQRVRRRERSLREAMGDFFASFDPRQYSFSLDFRRQIKARVMELEIPIQIIRESTLRLAPRQSMAEREVTPLSDRAWNIATALYYKSGDKPWKLSSARDGVCYVGVAFKDTEDRDRNACSAAQMFLDDGDGVVFLGDYGRWYTERKGEYHLTRAAAKRLLAGVLKTYQEQRGKPLQEVFLHCRSSINEDEFAGYSEACPPNVKLVGIRVAPERLGLRVYRRGTRPILRGSFWPVSERRGFLWGSGFKPRLRTYDGSDVPQPLCLEIQHGESDLELVAQDILGLTKLNYNCCKLGENQPVTIHFSDAVGEILVANRGATKILPNFKYYI